MEYVALFFAVLIYFWTLWRLLDFVAGLIHYWAESRNKKERS